MSVRNGLLALLAEGPAGAYRLRQDFERRTGGSWPLNAGQVSTTLARLVRDGLVLVDEAADAGVDQYRLSPSGRAAADAWWSTPVDRTAPARDELAIKLALAVSAPGVDVAAVVQAQRTDTLRRLRDYTLLAREGGPASDAGELAWSLVLDSLVFAGEAEARWLDHVEARVARAALDARRAVAAGGAPVSGTAASPADERDAARADR